MPDKPFIMGFFDETSSRIVRMMQRLWSFVRETIPVNLSTPRLNIFGFLAYNGNSLISFKKNSKSPSICEYMEEIRLANDNDKPIVLLLDNLPSHKTRMVREKAECLNIILVYNTPYSPELNPIEPVWGDSKKEICRILILTEEEAKTVYTEKFYQLTRQKNYADSWVDKFIDKADLIR